MCFFFFFGFETPFKDFLFYSLILLTLWFRYLQTRIMESCIYLSSQLFFETTLKTLKFQEKPRKIHFPTISKPKIQKFFLQYIPWCHPTEPLNFANSKETESLGKNDCRQKCLDKSLQVAGSVSAPFLCYKKTRNIFSKKKCLITPRCTENPS